MKEKFNDKVIFGLILLAIIFATLKVFYSNPLKRISNMNVPREYHQSILLDDGRVLITGGNNGSNFEGLKSAEILNLNTHKFTSVKDMNLPHQYHSMFKISNGNIAILDINGIEIFDVKNNAFKLLRTKPIKRRPEFNSYSFNLLPNDRILIVGGEIEKFGPHPIYVNKVEVIDLKNDKLIKTFDYVSDGQGTLTLDNGDVLLVGGVIRTAKNTVLSNKINRFDNKTLKIKHIGKLNIPTKQPYVFKLKNNEMLIICGEIFKRDVGGGFIITKKSPYYQVFNLQNNKAKLMGENNLLGKYETNNILQIDENVFVFNINTKKGSDLKFFDLLINDFKNKNDNNLNKSTLNQNMLLFENEILLSGGGKTPNLIQQKLSSEGRSENEIFIRTAINKAFMFSIKNND